MGSGINSLLGNPSFGNLLSSAIPALASGALGQNAFDEAFAKLRKTFNPGAAEQEMLDYVTGRSRGREMTGVESTINDMLAGGKIPGMEDLDKFAASSQKFADTPLDYKSILGQIDPIVQPYLQKAVESENYGRRKIGSALTASGSFYGTPQVDLEGRLARETNTAMSQAIAQLAQGERSLRSGEALAGNRGLSAVPGMRQSLLSGAQQLDPQKRILDERLDTSYKGAQLAGQSRGNIASATSTGIGQAAKMAETAAGTPYNVLALQQLLRGG
jgi:hypothetical protein